MRKPLLQDFDEDDGYGPNYEGYCDAMDTYADEQRDDMLEQRLMTDELAKEQERENTIKDK